MNDLLDEVKNDLKEEKYSNFIQKTTRFFIIAAVAIVLVVSIYVWKEQTTSKLQHKLSIWYNHGTSLIEQGKLDEAILAFDKIIKYPHQNYAALAYLSKAAILFEQEKFELGQSTIIEMNTHKQFSSALRELAQVIYLSHQLDSKTQDPDKVEEMLQRLTKENKTWRFSTLQLKALYQVKQNNFAEAKKILNEISEAKQASKSSQDTAKAILAVISRKD